MHDNLFIISDEGQIFSYCRYENFNIYILNSSMNITRK